MRLAIVGGTSSLLLLNRLVKSSLAHIGIDTIADKTFDLLLVDLEDGHLRYQEVLESIFFSIHHGLSARAVGGEPCIVTVVVSFLIF